MQYTTMKTCYSKVLFFCCESLWYIDPEKQLGNRCCAIQMQSREQKPLVPRCTACGLEQKGPFREIQKRGITKKSLLITSLSCNTEIGGSWEATWRPRWGCLSTVWHAKGGSGAGRNHPPLKDHKARAAVTVVDGWPGPCEPESLMKYRRARESRRKGRLTIDIGNKRLGVRFDSV